MKEITLINTEGPNLRLQKINKDNFIITLKKYPEIGILTRNYFIFVLNNLI